MDLKEYQKLASSLVDKLDEKFKIDRDAQLNISQLIEELGELVKVANLKRLRNQDAKKEDLAEEFADVFIQLAKLADSFDIDLEKAIIDKIEIIKKRHGL